MISMIDCAKRAAEAWPPRPGFLSAQCKSISLMPVGMLSPHDLVHARWPRALVRAARYLRLWLGAGVVALAL